MCLLAICEHPDYYFIREGRRKMGTIVFLVLKFAFGIDHLGDGQAIAIMVSLDSIALVLFLKLKR